MAGFCVATLEEGKENGHITVVEGVSTYNSTELPTSRGERRGSKRASAIKKRERKGKTQLVDFQREGLRDSRQTKKKEKKNEKKKKEKYSILRSRSVILRKREGKGGTSRKKGEKDAVPLLPYPRRPDRRRVGKKRKRGTFSSTNVEKRKKKCGGTAPWSSFAIWGVEARRKGEGAGVSAGGLEHRKFIRKKRRT